MLRCVSAFALFLLVGSCASTCLPSFGLFVGSASNLTELLALAQGIPASADKTYAGWQDELRANVTSLNNTLSEALLSYRSKYDGNVRFYCMRHYTNGLKSYERGREALQEIMAKDLVAVVRDKFAGKFEDNVEFIKKQIDACEAEPCASAEELANVRRRLLGVHDDWCKYANELLFDENSKAERCEKKAVGHIESASKRLSRWHCSRKQ